MSLPDIRFGTPMWLYEPGNADMGDVTAVVGAANYHRARFHLAGEHAIGAVRVHFGGSGATLEDVSMKVDSARGAAYNVELFKWENVGLNEDVSFRTPAGQLWQWLLADGDHLVFEYDNQHEGTLTWGIVLALVPILTGL